MTAADRIRWRWSALSRRIADAVLAPGAGVAIAGFLARHLDGDIDGPVLDVGCGPLPRRRMRHLVGVDLDPRAMGSFTRFAAGAVADGACLPFADGRFAAVVSVGLLHHIDDRRACATLAEMLRVARPGGKAIVFDGVAPEGTARRSLARSIRKLDRGAHLRSAADLARLLDSVGSWQRDLLTYAATGLQAIAAIHQIS